MRRPKPDADPTWKYPRLTRCEVENLRIYFSHLPNRIKSWHQQSSNDTHALPKELRGKDGPWSSVAPQYRDKVEAWFQRKLMELRERGIKPSPGKIRSLRCNAACYGRFMLTGGRKSFMLKHGWRKKKWRDYLAWEAEQQRKTAAEQQEPAPRKVLDIG